MLFEDFVWYRKQQTKGDIGANQASKYYDRVQVTLSQIHWHSVTESKRMPKAMRNINNRQVYVLYQSSIPDIGI